MTREQRLAALKKAAKAIHQAESPKTDFEKEFADIEPQINMILDVYEGLLPIIAADILSTIKSIQNL